MTKKTVKIQLKKGLIGSNERTKGTIRGLGLRRVDSVSELEDTDSVRGMIKKVAHLVKIID
jgi:large subunit ribosomal protein L30